MPGDLRDPTQMFPFHYDDRYNRTLHPLEMGGGASMDGIIQSIAEEIVGHPLGPDDLLLVHQHLNEKGMMSMNPGDQQFMEAVRRIISDRLLSKKVARKWLTLIG